MLGRIADKMGCKTRFRIEETEIPLDFLRFLWHNFRFLLQATPAGEKVEPQENQSETK
jgi:hypothetical protein